MPRNFSLLPCWWKASEKVHFVLTEYQHGTFWAVTSASKWTDCFQECITQAYTSKRRILNQVLPVPNVYTKSAHAYIHFAHICITRFGIRIGDRKYLNEYTPFGSVSLCFRNFVATGTKKYTPLKKGTICSNSTPGVLFWYPFSELSEGSAQLRLKKVYHIFPFTPIYVLTS